MEPACADRLAEQLQAAIDACLRGLKRLVPAAPTTPPGEVLYFKLLLQQSRLSQTDKHVLTAAARWRLHALRAARREMYGRARTSFALARRLVAGARTASGNCVVLCESFQLAGEAYLDYRLNRLVRAQERLDQASEIDARLEREGFALLHLHRVQLLHNMVRVAAKQGGKERALRLAFRLLGHLEGRREVLPGAGKWDARAIGDFPGNVVRTLFNQIVAEIAVILAANPDMHALFVAASAAHLDRCPGSACFRYPMAHAWLNLKRLFLEDRRLFLTSCCGLLENAYREMPLLWSAVVVDLVTICKDLDFLKANWLVLDLGLERIPRALDKALKALMAT